MPNLWTEDDFTLIENETTGRRAMVWPSGAVEERGWTNPRDITGLMAPGVVASGQVLLERIGHTVSLRLSNLVLAVGDGATNIALATASSEGSPMLSFRPRKVEMKTFLVQGNGQVARLTCNTQMQMQIHFALAGAVMNGSLLWVTRAGWPTSLPGVADGQPI